MIKKRFDVERHGMQPGPDYFSVIDRQHELFNLPPRAVSIYFISEEDANTVSDILNREWDTFLRTGR